MVNAFAIQAQWASASSGTWGEYDATLCNFRIEIGGENVTAYATDAGLHEDHLEIPAYYVAEWITENWWPLLWEPRKSEEAGDDYEFLTRHSLLTAEHGFALPSVQIVPGGERLQVSAHPRRAQHADAHFNRKSEAWIARKDAENALRKFVEETVLRLADKGHAATALEESWSLVRNTGPDEIEFCSLMGALGLSPYETHDNIESALDKASSMLSSEQMLDLCLTSTPENLVRSAYVAGHMNQAMQKVSQVDLATLQGFVPPSDDVGPAWRVGYKATQALRENLSIGETDFNGASAVFERLGIDPTVRQVVDLAGVESPIVGGIEKHESAAA